MKIDQLSIFDMPENPIPINVMAVAPKIKSASTIRDIRTDGQKNKAISFDVGEKIGGARKDLAKQREAFLAKPSIALLDEIEKTDVTTAAEIIIRNTFFTWFTLEDCRQRGVEPQVAKAMQLFINRIPKESKDSAVDRRKYVKMLTFLSDILRTVKTMKEYHLLESRVQAVMFKPRSEKVYITLEHLITSKMEELSYEERKESRDFLIQQIREYQGEIFLYEMATTMALSEYKGPFFNYFTKHSSRVTALNNAYSVKGWDELLPPATEMKAAKKRVIRKPVWERELPETPMRSGGLAIHIDNPKAYIEHFGFRSCEFGHYVGDESASEHLLRSAEAYTDLADILAIPTKAVNLNKELAMAFGSRGSGRALGHYEPARKVINLTKEKGSLGILAHEWFHSLDHYLFNASYAFKNGKIGFLTDEEHGELSSEAKNALTDLIQAIKVGNATAYYDVSNVEGTYRLTREFTDLYDAVDGDLFRFMDLRLIAFDEYFEETGGFYRSVNYSEKLRVKHANNRLKKIRTEAEALAIYHFERTGEKVNKIPYPTDRSEYMQFAVHMDKGKVGKYWSSNVELAARAFEGYVYDELITRGWTSDYLVCGIRDSVFPQGKERERINHFMKKFIDAVLPMLSK